MYMNLQEMISYVYTVYLSLQSTVNVFFCLIELCILFSNFRESRFIPSDTLLMAALMQPSPDFFLFWRKRASTPQDLCQAWCNCGSDSHRHLIQHYSYINENNICSFDTGVSVIFHVCQQHKLNLPIMLIDLDCFYFGMDNENSEADLELNIRILPI